MIKGKQNRKWKIPGMLLERKTRSSRQRCFVKKVFLKFTGKRLCQSLFFNEIAGGACNFIKREILAQVFSPEFYEIFKNIFFYRRPPVAAFEKLCAQLIWGPEIKVKLLWVGARKRKKGAFFVTFILSERNFLAFFFYLSL